MSMPLPGLRIPKIAEEQDHWLENRSVVLFVVEQMVSAILCLQS